MRLALHSVSYAGVWPGQVRLPLEPILDKAARFGYQGVMLVAKRPHASLLDVDPEDRRRLRGALEERGWSWRRWPATRTSAPGTTGRRSLAGATGALRRRAGPPGP